MMSVEKYLDLITHTSKFLWSSIFLIVVNYLKSQKIGTKTSVWHPQLHGLTLQNDETIMIMELSKDPDYGI